MPRIITWNINGLKSFTNRDPWNKHANFKSILDSFNADIICFQETKLSSKFKTEEVVALVDGYESYFSFCHSSIKTGYSGVVTYVKSGIWTPVDAEDGFTGYKTPSGRTTTASAQLGNAHTKTSTNMDSQPTVTSIGSYDLLYDEFSPTELAHFDSEGRCIITDHGLFVLFNIYFPNDAGQERTEFKLNFHRAVELRVRGLIRDGREVVVVGDVNVTRSELDHCDPQRSILEHNLVNFTDLPSRQWFASFLSPDGPFHDLYRSYHPTERKYTCWNTYLSARESNYGTRIDYILCTSGVKHLFTGCDVLDDVYGSDHCPVVADLCELDEQHGMGIEELLSKRWVNLYQRHKEDAGKCPVKTTNDRDEEHKEKSSTAQGKQITLSKRQPPPLCSQYWDTFKAKKLTSFFTIGSASQSSQSSNASTSNTQTSTSSSSVSQTKSTTDTQPTTTTSKSKQPTSKKQMSLRNFFTSSTTNTTKKEESATEHTETEDLNSLMESEFLASTTTTTTTSVTSTNTSTTTASWSSIFTKQIPKCYHDETCAELVVRKPGPNKGRVFYACARGVGPSADAKTKEGTKDGAKEGGTTKKRRVVGEFRCDFFEWKNKGKWKS